MSPEERDMLEKSLALAEENNKILHSMKRGQRLATVASVIYWIILIGSAVGAFYLIQPYIDEVKNMYESVGDGLKSLNFNK